MATLKSISKLSDKAEVFASLRGSFVYRCLKLPNFWFAYCLRILRWRPSSMSLMHIMNSTGYWTDLCGIPLVPNPVIASCMILSINPSKVFWKSRYTMYNDVIVLWIARRSLWSINRLEKHDLLYIKPCLQVTDQKISFKVTNNYVSNYASKDFANYRWQVHGTAIPGNVSTAFPKDWCDICCFLIDWDWALL